MSIKLQDHLYPRGASALDPNTMPSVLDSDGAQVTYYGTNRITSESTVVDLGDAPNSNTGDALRTAFIKINNFIEASYWNNDAVVQKLGEIDARLTAIEARLTAGGL